jgi:hypothetical protein
VPPRAVTADRIGRLATDTVEALISGRCDELLAAAEKALAAGSVAAELAAGARLRAAGHPAELVAAAFSQAELRRRAVVKFSRAESMLFTRDGLEQASGEAAARHRARRFDGLDQLADLCTGVGGDLLALAEGREVLAVDLDETHLRFAVHNADVYGNASGVEPVRADVRDVDLTGIEGAFVDPARRAGAASQGALGRGAAGRGLPSALAAGAGNPPLRWCFDLAERLGPVVVKAVPGLDVGIVPDGWEVEFVAEGRDLKEAVLVSPALARAARRATVLPAGAARRAGPVSLAGEPDAEHDADADADRDGDGRLAVRAPGDYLYDPSPAVTRAGLVGLLGRQLDAWQIDPRIAFLTCDEARPTPFARLLRVCDSVPFDLRRLTALLRTYRLGSLDVRRRGLAGDVDAIRRSLLPARRDIVPGGAAVTVVMTRLDDRPWALVCTEPPVPPPPVPCA